MRRLLAVCALVGALIPAGIVATGCTAPASGKDHVCDSRSYYGWLAGCRT